MNKRILWIEDDYFAIRGLLRPLQKDNFIVDSAQSAVDGYEKAQNWLIYDLIIVDLILPLSIDSLEIPEKVASWNDEVHVGVGLVKWLLTELKVKCPVMVLSVINDPIQRYHLENLGIAGCLAKRGLLPSKVANEVYRLLGVGDSVIRA